MQLDTLFSEFLNVLNRAIGRHEGSFPWQQFFAATGRLRSGKKIVAAVYDDGSSTPKKYFTIRMFDESVALLSSGREDDVDIVWDISEAYLREVVDNPDLYVEHPRRLDVEWLRSRMGMRPPSRRRVV